MYEVRAGGGGGVAQRESAESSRVKIRAPSPPLIPTSLRPPRASAKDTVEHCMSSAVVGMASATDDEDSSRTNLNND